MRVGSHVLLQGTFRTLDLTGREITVGQRTMSGQNAELSGQILTLTLSVKE